MAAAGLPPFRSPSRAQSLPLLPLRESTRAAANLDVEGRSETLLPPRFPLSDVLVEGCCHGGGVGADGLFDERCGGGGSGGGGEGGGGGARGGDGEARERGCEDLARYGQLRMRYVLGRRQGEAGELGPDDLLMIQTTSIGGGIDAGFVEVCACVCFFSSPYMFCVCFSLLLILVFLVFLNLLVLLVFLVVVFVFFCFCLGRRRVAYAAPNRPRGTRLLYCNALCHYDVLYYCTTMHSTILGCAGLGWAVLCWTVLSCDVLCYALLCYGLCCAVLCIVCRAVPYCCTALVVCELYCTAPPALSRSAPRICLFVCCSFVSSSAQGDRKKLHAGLHGAAR